MIVLDLETSGIDLMKCGIWQIGAIEFENLSNFFFGECRIDDEDEIISSPENKKTVYEVTGKTEKDFRDPKKQSQKQLLKKFFEWCEKAKIKNFMCENPQFDVAFLKVKARKYGLKFPFHYRAFDLHSISSLKHLQVKGDLLIENDHSGLDLTNSLKFCGMKDERKEHNALEDAKLEAECFSRLLHGRPLFKEFEKFKIPEYLIKK